MIGRWRLANGYFANIDRQFLGHWVGVVEIRVGMTWEEIPSFWDKNGDSPNPHFNLEEKISGPEYFGQRRKKE